MLKALKNKHLAKKNRKNLAFSVLLTAMLLLASAHLQADVSLKFGVYTSDKPSTVVRQFRPVLSALEKTLTDKLQQPVSITMQVSKSYAEGIADLVNGAVDFSRFGPASYIEAKNKNDQLKLLVAEAKKGEKVFYGVICVAADSPIQSLSELKGKRFAFGSEKSTIGRYLAQLNLMENDVLAKDLAAYEYLGRHDKVGTAVAVGNFDAGALKEGTYKKLLKKGHSLRVISRFENVTKPWIARSGMDDDIFNALQQSLLEFDNSDALKALKKSGFTSVTDKDYDRIRASIEQNPAFFE